ncbi:hypothetical protein PYCC9005_004722 [Savitreella phatthalungensis]
MAAYLPRTTPSPVEGGHRDGSVDKYHFEARWSDYGVNIGNLDLFESVWQSYWNLSDDRGVSSDALYRTLTDNCISRETPPRYEVNVQLEGTWGSLSPLSGWDIRTALFEALWETLNFLARKAKLHWDVYSDCEGLDSIGNSPFLRPDAACGPKSSLVCDTACDGRAGVQCRTYKQAYTLPETLHISLYDSADVLQTPSLTLTFESRDLRINNFCQTTFEGVLEQVLLRLPVVSKDTSFVISSVLQVGCSQDATNAEP